jgi:hypothetical protein
MSYSSTSFAKSSLQNGERFPDATKSKITKIIEPDADREKTFTLTNIENIGEVGTIFQIKVASAIAPIPNLEGSKFVSGSIVMHLLMLKNKWESHNGQGLYLEKEKIHQLIRALRQFIAANFNGQEITPELTQKLSSYLIPDKVQGISPDTLNALKAKVAAFFYRLLTNRA